MTDRPSLNQCKCSFSIRLNGDGCMYCNPEFWNEFYRRQAEDERAEALKDK